MNDRSLGILILLTSGLLFGYYTLWTLVTPFVDEDHFIQEYFPDRRLAAVIPIVVLLFVSTGLLTFIALVMINSRPSQAPKPPSHPKQQ